MSVRDIDEILDQLEHFLRNRDGGSLPNGQRAVLYGLLAQPTLRYEQLATELRNLGRGSYKPQTLKNDAYNLFRRLTQAFGFEVKKRNLQRRVFEWLKEQETLDTSENGFANSSPALQTPGSLLPLACWQDDLARLTRLVGEGRRVLGISGPPRIGKTYFTYALCDRLKSMFEMPPIWCMASHVPTPEALYREVMRQLDEPAIQEAAIPALMQLFRYHRRLLVIDGTEVLYESQQLAGHFARATGDYEIWLKQLLEVPIHQSCLLWVGREPPACFSPRGILELHQVSRLQEQDALILLNTWNPPLESAEERARLLHFCGGNPAWLLMVMTRIQQLYAGNVAAFLASPSLAEEAMETLGYTLERLSPVERLLLIWLMLRPLSPERLLHCPIPGTSLDDRREALLSLQKRGLVQQGPGNTCYQVDPPLLSYGLARQVVRQAEAEICAGTLNYLCHYPLLDTIAPAHLQAWQRHHLVKAIAQRLQRRYAFRNEQITLLQQCLVSVQSMPSPQQGYAVGNLLNLAAVLNLPMTELEVDGLEIRHADLRLVNWKQATLANCTFRQTLLPTNLRDRLTAAISPDGTLVAAGDQHGHFLCWRREEEHMHLQAIWKMPSGIAIVLCPESDLSLFIANQEVYTWWIDGEPHPRKIIDLPQPATCLTQSSLGQVAVGLLNGQILLWNDSLNPLKILHSHQSDICNLSFSPDGLRLASIDRDNRVLEWNLAGESNEILDWREIQTRGLVVCLAVSWDHDTLLRAEVSPYRVRLWPGDTHPQDEAIADEWITALHFSANGRYLVGRTDGDRVIYWNWKFQPPILLDSGVLPRGDLAITCDGQWILATSPKHLQLFDLQRQANIWQADVVVGDWSGTTFKRVAGLSAVENELLRSLGTRITS